MRIATVLVPLLAAAAVVAGCSSEYVEDEGESWGGVSVLDDEVPLVKNGRDEEIAVPKAGTILTEIAQPELLARLDREGYGFANVVGEKERLTNADLAERSETYKQIAADVTADVDAMRKADPALTTKVVTYKNRVFDSGWLKSKWATFDLISVVNRVDRKDMQGDGRCGELRFVYRLAYVKTNEAVPAFSRMPFFFNVVYDIQGPDCRDAAKRWQVASSEQSADAYVAWLKKGALDLRHVRLKQIELNAQVVRIPSENKRDMGGIAEYFLRVYRLSQGAVVAAPLENTPDVKRVAADPALRAELLEWVKANVRGIDEGTAIMPDKFSATKALSSTTFGSARKVNKLFSQIFKPSELKDVAFAEAKLVGSAEALLFRLDDMTCAGCHQGRSVAGFHLLGADRGTRMNPLNGLRVHGSPHFLAELERRSTYLSALIAGEEPEITRPSSFEPAPGTAASVGTHCVAPEDRAKFKRNWDCEVGTTCKMLATNANSPIELGECLPTSGGFAGLPCITGAITDGATSRADKLAMKNIGCQGNYACLTPDEGTPGGMCAGACKGGVGTMNGKNEICAYGGGTAFDTCAMKSNFATCIDRVVNPAPRPACDDDHPCREDFMCQRLEPLKANGTFSTTPKGMGYCNPTYFIFQMRLDGHPSPEG